MPAFLMFARLICNAVEEAGGESQAPLLHALVHLPLHQLLLVLAFGQHQLPFVIAEHQVLQSAD